MYAADRPGCVALQGWAPGLVLVCTPAGCGVHLQYKSVSWAESLCTCDMIMRWASLSLPPHLTPLT